MDATKNVNTQKEVSALDRPLGSLFTLNWATVLFSAILLITVISRYAMLGERVMSHDETSHVYFSWLLEQGRGYKHDPVTHGPLQFHLIALSYFLFGDTDFTARIPHALASILTVVFMWNYRRYLGRVGWLVAAVLLVISPYMLYYGRYARNEAFVALFTVIGLWAVLRYFDTGATRYLFWFTASTVLHYTSKETSFIFSAQMLLFLAMYLLFRVTQTSWVRPQSRQLFVISLLLGVLLLAGALISLSTGEAQAPQTATPTVYPAPATAAAPETTIPLLALLLAGLGMAGLVVALYFLFQGYPLKKLRTERSFDLLILLGTLVLPMLTPFPVKLMGWNPLDYSSQGMTHTALFLVPLALISIGIGLWWNRRVWLANAALFYAIFIVFYTTIFTNGAGFFTGMVGSLGYWLAQQGVERGSQPWYYYVLLQIPIYEFLPALGSLLAFGLAIFGIRRTAAEPAATPDGEPGEADSQRLAVTLLGYWIITSAFAYTYAGEKMPWLTVHIALPMILLSGWAFGWLIESIDWKAFRERRGFLIVILGLVFLVSLAGVFASLLGTNPPFQGKQIEQLQASSTFLFSMLMVIASGAGLVYLLRIWPSGQILRLLGLIFFSLLAVLTARTAYTASFINYDYANEYLVYAHSGPGAKLIMDQVDDISERLTDGKALVVAYDDKTTYPFWWYLRNYKNTRFFGANPTRDLRDAPVVIVGSENYGKVEPIVGQAFHPFEYVRMWWPNQDYTALTWENINNARTREIRTVQAEQGITEPIPEMGFGEYLGQVWSHLRPFFTDAQVRRAVWDIWLNRDFARWGALTGQDTSLPNWQPAEKMRMYLRKDIAAQIWNYGVGPSSAEIIADPYEGKEVSLTADIVIGTQGSGPGQFNRPRDLAVAPDGTLYVADTDNHRVQHLSPNGQVLHTWGSFADLSKGEAPGGTFYEPWGIAVDQDGFVYVADTWNHRIQKFTSEGEFVKMWGYFGQGEKPEAFWGPRDVAIDPEGRVLVSDTGNKRIVSFDADGNFVSEFGSQGFEPGEFYEPVGIAINDQGNLYVADTWNQRIQSFQPNGDGTYQPLMSWDVNAWFGQSLDNKPYLAVDDQGHVFATDPEGYRVLEFLENGSIIRYWGDYGLGDDSFGLAGSVAVDLQGGVWVSDAGNHRLMHFKLPEE